MNREPMRNEHTCEGLLVYLANHYTPRGVQIEHVVNQARIWNRLEMDVLILAKPRFGHLRHKAMMCFIFNFIVELIGYFSEYQVQYIDD